MKGALRIALVFSAYCLPPTAYCQFDRIVIDDDFPGAYQVEVADVNGDKKPDIVALGGGTCAWYENPTWTKRIITGPDQTPGIITSATADLDGDGKAEVAIGYEFAMNEPKKGRLGLAVQAGDGAWSFKPIMDIGSIHRIRWRVFDGERNPDLVVAPIFGPLAESPRYEDPARLLIVDPGKTPLAGKWSAAEIARRPVIHAIDVVRMPDGPDLLLTADNGGICAMMFADRPMKGGLLLAPLQPGDFLFILEELVEGAKGEPANRGCSEVHLGQIKSRELGFVATIEPWHGNQAVVHCSGRKDKGEFRRHVIDDTLDAGHALWVADIDGDGDDEILAGHRGKDHRVSMYKYDRQADRWGRTVIDREIAAQDLRGGDLDGNGTPDMVAVGGSTHNVVWYRPRVGR